MSHNIAFISNDESEFNELSVFVEKGILREIDLRLIKQNELQKVLDVVPDVIILDLELNNSDGIEVCHYLKNEKKVSSYIILRSNKKEEYVELEAFKVGVDDYISKTINKRVLAKKINALLNRKTGKNNGRNSGDKIAFRNIVVDVESFTIIRNNEELFLPKKDFEMFKLFLQNPNITYTREDIYNKIWNNAKGYNPRIIDVHIRKIREKIGNNIIQTVKGVGYQLAS